MRAFVGLANIHGANLVGSHGFKRPVHNPCSRFHGQSNRSLLDLTAVDWKVRGTCSLLSQIVDGSDFPDEQRNPYVGTSNTRIVECEPL